MDTVSGERPWNSEPTEGFRLVSKADLDEWERERLSRYGVTPQEVEAAKQAKHERERQRLQALRDAAKAHGRFSSTPVATGPDGRLSQSELSTKDGPKALDARREIPTVVQLETGHDGASAPLSDVPLRSTHHVARGPTDRMTIFMRRRAVLNLVNDQTAEELYAGAIEKGICTSRTAARRDVEWLVAKGYVEKHAQWRERRCHRTELGDRALSISIPPPGPRRSR